MSRREYQGALRLLRYLARGRVQVWYEDGQWCAHVGGETDEGHHHEWWTATHRGGRTWDVQHDVRGRDCDGPYREGNDWCLVWRRRALPGAHPDYRITGVRRTSLRSEHAWRRDLAAEAAGY